MDVIPIINSTRSSNTMSLATMFSAFDLFPRTIVIGAKVNYKDLLKGMFGKSSRIGLDFLLDSWSG